MLPKDGRIYTICLWLYNSTAETNVEIGITFSVQGKQRMRMSEEERAEQSFKGHEWHGAEDNLHNDELHNL